MELPNDHTLLQWVRSDDEGQRDRFFRLAYTHYYESIEMMVLKNNGTKSEAKDLFQDGLIVLYQHILKKNFHGNSSIKTYFYAICRKLWLKKLKKDLPTTEIDAGVREIKVDPEPEKVLIGNERTQLIEQLLDQLGSDCYKLLKLFYYEHYSMRKIKQYFGLANEQVAKNKKAKCMRKLREKLSQHPNYLKLLKGD